MQTACEELRILGTGALVLERQHCDRMIGDHDRLLRRDIGLHIVLPEQKADGDDEDADNQVVDLLAGSGGYRLALGHVGRAEHTIGCQLECPGENNGDRKPQDQERDEECGCPFRQAQGGEHHITDLHKQPADDDVDDRDAEDIAPLQFLDERSRHLAPKVFFKHSKNGYHVALCSSD